MNETVKINKSNLSIDLIQTKMFIIFFNSNLKSKTLIFLFSSSQQKLSITTIQRLSTTTSAYSAVYSEKDHFFNFSKNIKHNKNKISELQKIISSFFSFAMTIKTIETYMFSNEKKKKKYDETIEHKETLTMTLTYKIIQLILIEKRLNHTTIKLFEL